jgi:hypothetical protein
MKTAWLALPAVALLTVGCTEPTATNPAASTLPATGGLLASAQGHGPVVHRATVGSSDIVPPGVDPNFSLVALEYAGGSVSGQWSDQFGHGNGGVHVAIDCLNVIGNVATIGGVATDQNFGGLRVLTRVVDNPDLISFSIINPVQFGLNPDCHAAQGLPLFPITNGQVKVD